MSFRKRNTVLSSAPVTGPAARVQRAPPPGTRPSPLDGRLTTSTGTSSLDGLLAGHAGLPLGTSLLVEEQGTTDFAGVLLRYFAAEGLVQGHHVHVLGVPDAWKRELPGLASQESKGTSKAPASVPEDRMKIAWRYEALSNQQAVPNAVAKDSSGASGTTFCHAFDLSKRLLPKDSSGSFFAYPMPSPLDAVSLEQGHSSQASSMSSLLSKLQTYLSSDSGTAVHRVIIPSLMSPTLYDGSACLPDEVLPFLHGLRGLLRQYSGRLGVMLSLPTTLFPRHNGLTRWIELLCDGVMELVPLPPSATETPATSKASSKDAEKAQGMARVYTMPAYHEKGGGGPEGKQFRQDLSFSLSSSRGLVIKPYSLPPLEDDENHHEKSPASTVKDGIDF